MKEISTYIAASKGLHLWMARNLHDSTIARNRRKMLSVACFDQAMEHHLAIVVLLEGKINGSGFALLRLLVEAYVRGIWLKNCASESDLDAYCAETLNRKFYQLIADIDGISDASTSILSKFKTVAWKTLNSYAHTGFMQSSRRLSREFIEPTYMLEEVLEILKFGNIFAVLAFQQLMDEIGRLDLAQEAGAKLELDTLVPRRE